MTRILTTLIGLVLFLPVFSCKEKPNEPLVNPDKPVNTPDFDPSYPATFAAFPYCMVGAGYTEPGIYDFEAAHGGVLNESRSGVTPKGDKFISFDVTGGECLFRSYTIENGTNFIKSCMAMYDPLSLTLLPDNEETGWNLNPNFISLMLFSGFTKPELTKDKIYYEAVNTEKKLKVALQPLHFETESEEPPKYYTGIIYLPV